jgi:hypothetical protein
MKIYSVAVLTLISLFFSAHAAFAKDIYCDLCGERIVGEYVKVREKGSVVKNYCPYCFRHHVEKTCSVCGESLNGKYLVDVYGNEYHPEHQQTHHRCDSCGRIISERTTGGGVMLPDGRTICNVCHRHAVTNNQTLDQLMRRTAEILTGIGIAIPVHNIQVALIDRNQMRSMYLSGHGKHVRGLCISEYKKARNVRYPAHRHTIYILSGLSVLDTEAALAHELMHAYINERPALRQKLQRQKIEEGMCEFISFVYLSRGNTEEILARLKGIAHNRDPVYGEGFRKVHAMFKNGTTDDVVVYLNAP